MQVILGVAAGIMVIGMLCTWGVSVIKNKNCIRHEKKGHLEIQNKRENKKVSEDSGKDKVNFKDSIERNTTSMQNTAEVLHQKEKISISQKNCGETVVLSANIVTGPATLVSREPGELATIYLQNELTVIGKMENAADAVIELINLLERERPAEVKPRVRHRGRTAEGRDHGALRLVQLVGEHRDQKNHRNYDAQQHRRPMFEKVTRRHTSKTSLNRLCEMNRFR